MAKFDIFAPQNTGMVNSLAGQKILIYGDSDTGKAIPNSVTIPTPDGFKTVGSIKEGDYLFDNHGQPTKVIKVYPQGKKEVWQLTFSDGRKAKCCVEHLWGVYNSHNKLVTLSTSELVNKFSPYSYKIPLTAPVEYTEKKYFIPPYEMGLFLGDASFRNTKLEYSSADSTLPSRIAQDMGWSYKKNSPKNYTYTFKDSEGNGIKTDYVLQEFPELIGCYSGEKFIPQEYMFGSAKQRLDLMRGLLDTDGSFCGRGGILYSTTSPMLRDGIIELSYSLGFKATYSIDSRYGKNDCYNVYIACSPEMKYQIFSLPSHINRIRQWDEQHNRKVHNNKSTIVCIENLHYEEEMTCFVVDNPEHLFLMNDYIVTHNTFQATRLDKPILLMAEAGGSARNVPKFSIVSWDNFTDIVKQLTADIDKTKERFQTVIIDTVEELVSRSEEKVAKRYGVTEVGMVQQAADGNPNGYSVARAQFKQQINLLTSVGLTVVFISHSQEIDYVDPFNNEKYKKFVPYGSEKEKGSTRFVRNLCDFVIYTQAQGIDPETSKTIYSKALCKETKRAFARSRYTQMQTYIEKFTAENLTEAIKLAIKKEAENEGAGLVEFKPENALYTKDDYVSMIQPYFQKLYSLYPDYVMNVVTQNLGEGRKISSATEDDITELSNIYGDFVSFACDRGIVVE